MKRDLTQLQNPNQIWDVLIIGGGATGLGCGVEAASRGHKTLLLEQSDFAKGTSSRSTKLIHGGVRYLKQGNISLVREALHERGLLVENAPHLVRRLPLVVAHYKWWEVPFYALGLKVYDFLAGQLNIGVSKHLSRKETLKHLPTIDPNGLKGGTLFYDGQFDDARLAISLARTMAAQGGVPLNYIKVTGLLKTSLGVAGVMAEDAESGQTYQIQAKVVINATGIFADEIRQMDSPNVQKLLSVSQGIHVVLDKSFLPGDSALMIPNTDDGRVLFAIPWHNRVVVGTTDTPMSQPELEPKPLGEEVLFLLNHISRYLTKAPQPSDVLSSFAGLRPLITGSKKEAEKTSGLSREHSIFVSDSGLLTIAGGKWTTYRNMGKDTIDRAESLAELPPQTSKTETLQLQGWSDQAASFNGLAIYGSDASSIQHFQQLEPELGQPLHPNLPYLKAEVVWATREEMARTVEDVLSRRTRALLLDAKASVEAAPEVAWLMAAELNLDEAWQQRQVAAYSQLAQRYVLSV